MANASGQLILLLPERRRFAGQPISPAIGKRLGRADRPQVVEADAGERQQLLRYFELLPRGWPMASITRQFDSGDAGAYAWLRADPVYLRPDMTGARLMAWGNLQVSAAEAEAFLQPLRPLFGDAGFAISASDPERWYLILPRESPFPAFRPPSESLGEDLLSHLPEGPEGRRWRALLNEAQIILHNHPHNAARVAAGLLPVNSVWFWGGGVLPDSVTCGAQAVASDDAELLALARLAGITITSTETGNAVIDLRSLRDWSALENRHIAPALTELGRRYGSVLLDFADGARFRLEGMQRWRFWRKAFARLES